MNRNDVLDRIRSKVGTSNVCDSCSRDKCRVTMTDVPSPRVVVDVDRAFPPGHAKGKQCDYVLFFVASGPDKLVAAPIELKSGGVDASTASAQLRQGAVFAEKVAPAGSNVVCLPILFHGKSIHRKQREELNRTKVRFRGRDLTIKTARCGRPRNLAQALSAVTAKSSP